MRQSKPASAWSSTTTTLRNNPSPTESGKSILQSISKELEEWTKVSDTGSQYVALSRCITRLGSLLLPVKQVPLTKEIIVVVRWLLLAINTGLDKDEDYTHIATFVTHAIAQDQLILRGLTVVSTSSSMNMEEELSMETDDGVFAGMFVFLLIYLHRTMDRWSIPQNASQDGVDSGTLTVQNMGVDVHHHQTTSASTVSAVVACLHCLILMVERSCAFSSKQPSMIPADPASVPPVLMVFERCRFRFLQVVYFYCQRHTSMVVPDHRSNHTAIDHDTHQGCVRVAVSVLGRLLALPFLAITALPPPPSTTPLSPFDESFPSGVGVRMPWVLTLRTRGSASSRTNGSGRRRVVLPCLDELYQPFSSPTSSSLSSSSSSAAAAAPATHRHPRQTAVAFRVLLEQSIQFLVNTLKSAIHEQVTTDSESSNSDSNSLLMLSTAMEALSRLAEVPLYASVRLLSTESLYDLLCYSLDNDDHFDANSKGSDCLAVRGGNGTSSIGSGNSGGGRSSSGSSSVTGSSGMSFADIDGSRRLSLFGPNFQAVLQAVYAVFTRVLPRLLPPQSLLLSTSSSSSSSSGLPLSSSSSGPPLPSWLALRLSALHLLSSLGIRDAPSLASSWQLFLSDPLAVDNALEGYALMAIARGTRTRPTTTTTATTTTATTITTTAATTTTASSTALNTDRSQLHPPLLPPPPPRFKSILLSMLQLTPATTATSSLTTTAATVRESNHSNSHLGSDCSSDDDDGGGLLRAGVYQAIGAMVAGMDLSKWMISTTSRNNNHKQRISPISSMNKTATTVVKLVRVLAMSIEMETNVRAMRQLLETIRVFLVTLPLAPGQGLTPGQSLRLGSSSSSSSISRRVVVVGAGVGGVAMGGMQEVEALCTFIVVKILHLATTTASSTVSTKPPSITLACVCLDWLSSLTTDDSLLSLSPGSSSGVSRKPLSALRCIARAMIAIPFTTTDQGLGQGPDKSVVANVSEKNQNKVNNKDEGEEEGDDSWVSVGGSGNGKGARAKARPAATVQPGAVRGGGMTKSTAIVGSSGVDGVGDGDVKAITLLDHLALLCYTDVPLPHSSDEDADHAEMILSLRTKRRQALLDLAVSYPTVCCPSLPNVGIDPNPGPGSSPNPSAAPWLNPLSRLIITSSCPLTRQFVLKVVAALLPCLFLDEINSHNPAVHYGAAGHHSHHSHDTSAPSAPPSPLNLHTLVAMILQAVTSDSDHHVRMYAVAALGRLTAHHWQAFHLTTVNGAGGSSSSSSSSTSSSPSIRLSVASVFTGLLRGCVDPIGTVRVAAYKGMGDAFLQDALACTIPSSTTSPTSNDNNNNNNHSNGRLGEDTSPVFVCVSREGVAAIAGNLRHGCASDSKLAVRLQATYALGNFLYVVLTAAAASAVPTVMPTALTPPPPQPQPQPQPVPVFVAFAADATRLWSLFTLARRLLEDSDKLVASAVRCLGLLVGALARVPELGLGPGPGLALGPGLGPEPVGMDAFAELALAIVQKVLLPIGSRDHYRSRDDNNPTLSPSPSPTPSTVAIATATSTTTPPSPWKSTPAVVKTAVNTPTTKTTTTATATTNTSTATAVSTTTATNTVPVSVVPVAARNGSGSVWGRAVGSTPSAVLITASVPRPTPAPAPAQASGATVVHHVDVDRLLTALEHSWDVTELTRTAVQRCPNKLLFSACQAIGLIACVLPTPGASLSSSALSPHDRCAVQLRLVLLSLLRHGALKVQVQASRALLAMTLRDNRQGLESEANSSLRQRPDPPSEPASGVESRASLVLDTALLVLTTSHAGGVSCTSTSTGSGANGQTGHHPLSRGGFIAQLAMDNSNNRTMPTSISSISPPLTGKRTVDEASRGMVLEQSLLMLIRHTLTAIIPKERDDAIAGVLAHHADDLADWLLATTHALLFAMDPKGVLGQIGGIHRDSGIYPSKKPSPSKSSGQGGVPPPPAPPGGHVTFFDHRLNCIVLSEVALMQAIPPSSISTNPSTIATTTTSHSHHSTTALTHELPPPSSGSWTVCQVIFDLVEAIWTVLVGHDVDDPPLSSSPASKGRDGRDKNITDVSSSWEHREERVASTTLDKYLRLRTMLTHVLMSSSATTSTTFEAPTGSGHDFFGIDDDEEEEEEEFEI